MVLVLSRSLATASLASLPSSIPPSLKNHRRIFNSRSSVLPQNGVGNGFSCSGLRWKLEKRNHWIAVRCEAKVAEKEPKETSNGEKFEYQAKMSVFSCREVNKDSDFIVSRLMGLIVHSLYSHKEVFLRELVRAV